MSSVGSVNTIGRDLGPIEQWRRPREVSPAMKRQSVDEEGHRRAASSGGVTASGPFSSAPIDDYPSEIYSKRFSGQCLLQLAEFLDSQQVSRYGQWCLKRCRG